MQLMFQKFHEDVYKDIELLFLDAKVADCLSMGGLCKYLVRENSVVTTDFILQYMTLSIRGRLGNRVSILLGRALLYYIYSPEGLEDS